MPLDPTLLSLTLLDAAAAGFGFVAGVLIYVSGIGGGVVVVPGLMAWFGLSAPVAVGTASLFSFVCKVGAGFDHARAGNASGALMKQFLWHAVPLCIAAAATIVAITRWLPQHAGSLNTALKLLTCCAGLLALATLFRPNWRSALGRLGLPSAAAITGALVGSTGTGGGVLVVPSLLSTSQESAQRVVGTSIWIGLVLSALTGLFYSASGSIAHRVAIAMIAGSLLAVPVGAWLFARMSEAHIKWTTAVLGGAAIGSLALGLVRGLFRSV